MSITPAIAKSITQSVARARSERELIDVHKVAEAIRVKHEKDNVALEDIIEQLVLAAGPNVPLAWMQEPVALAMVDRETSHTALTGKVALTERLQTEEDA